MKFNLAKIKTVGTVKNVRNDEDGNVLIIIFEYQGEVFSCIPSANLIHHLNPDFGGVIDTDGNVKGTSSPLPDNLRKIMIELYKEIKNV